jgi:hypothetical protein
VTAYCTRATPGAPPGRFILHRATFLALGDLAVAAHNPRDSRVSRDRLVPLVPVPGGRVPHGCDNGICDNNHKDAG